MTSQQQQQQQHQNSAALTNVEIERYSRQLIIPEFNLDGEKMKKS